MKKKIVTKKLDITVVPTLDGLMNDALSIIGAELGQYKSKTKRGITLDLKEARAVQGYMETLVKLSRENREQARSEALEGLSDADLAQLADEVLQKDSKRLIKGNTGSEKESSE